MRTRVFWMVALGLPLLLIGGSPSLGQAGEAEQKAQAPATTEKAQEPSKESTETSKTPEAAEKKAEAKRPTGLVGTVVAVSPASGTLVVDVPRGKEVLRIGAEVTGRTRIRANNRKASLDALKEGERVRINFHRIATGDEAISVDVLRAAKG